ncbi:MAG: putative mov34/MPN/PAD family protein [Nitrososphaeraceae archaeon]|nr:putative mov34/MPN/PAD family protein [Nitrososphaeraceae archaeon]
MENEILIMHHDHLNELRKLAIGSLPNESCAILLGEKSETKNLVKYILPLNNSAQSSTAFIIDSDELFNVYKKAKLMKLNVISIFHSHPSNPFPSETDKIYMDLNPVIWIIYSTYSNSFKSFMLDSFNDFREIKIELIKD